MKIAAHLLPDDPETLPRMMVELQLHMDEKLSEKRRTSSRTSTCLFHETSQRVRGLPIVC